MKPFVLVVIACYLLTSACSVASSQPQEKPQAQQVAQQNSQIAQTVPQQEATPPENEQVYEISEGVKKRIEFKRGRTTATVKGRVIRMSSEEYAIAARAGQRMTVIITSV